MEEVECIPEEFSAAGRRFQRRRPYDEEKNMTPRFARTQVFPHGAAPVEGGAALRLIEICGRTAYKSEDKITDDSAKAFVLMLKKHKHLSVLEHSNIVLKVEGDASTSGSPRSFGGVFLGLLRERNSYHRVHPFSGDAPEGVAFAGNIRSWIETLECLKGKDGLQHDFFAHHLNRFYPDLFPYDGGVPSCGERWRVSLMEEAEQLETLRKYAFSDLPVFVFRFVCDRGITHEVVRHRVLSFTQESTRYVNYGNAGITLILPEELEPYYDEALGEFTERAPVVESWLHRAEVLFNWYMEDLGRGLKPQIARDILPNLLKSEILVSGRWSGWKHFIELRNTPQAHPRIRLLAEGVSGYFHSLGLL